MEPTTFQLYKISKKQNTIYLVLTINMLIIGIVGFVLTKVFELKVFDGNTALNVLFLFQGAGGIFIAKNNFKVADYFVSWDNNEISFQLPDKKTLETIKIDNIKSIEKAPQEIQITLNYNEIKHFRFIYFYFPKRTSVLNYFESLKAQIDNRDKLAV